MNIEQKSKLVKDFNLFHYLYKGAYIDAMDTTNKYLVAQITEKDENFLSVNFDGWSHKFDQVSQRYKFNFWLEIQSQLI